MQSNKNRDTAPELAVRALLHAAGYRVNYRPVPGLRRSAGIVFTRAHITAFIDGCFWHGCPVHYQRPTLNQGYWNLKVVGNMVRDRNTAERLTAEGWTVLRFWEHEDPGAVTAAVESELERHRLDR
ncbi:DNA mismatch endonuclease Vsr [Cryobacterium suzukii]|uniref:DNA mismatch endonuclease Vsr n=2 Tax=Cryobacterium suzukii TaxID=1259198 RepID=A0A4R9AEK1_9MICO|nr:DNA mismatch endonuclease Vsr [Cryobacterium suzukii]